MAYTTYNERSWGIDLISNINSWISGRDLLLKRAGGETTIHDHRNVLFPDLLIYGDNNQGKILQGWELKFPDTPIDDDEFIENAKKKALILNLNSFLLWNVSYAILYKINPDGTIIVLNVWDSLKDLDTREKVANAKNRTFELLDQILPTINDLFMNGTIRYVSTNDFILSEKFISTIQSNIDVYSAKLSDASSKDPNFSREITLWWRYAKDNFSEGVSKFEVLARNNLLFLIDRFILAHLLKSHSKVAYLIDTITHDCSIDDALEIFKKISSACDFWDIFNKRIGEEYLPNIVWQDLLQLNSLLKDLQLHHIDNENISDLLHSLVEKSKRKVAGQYATPINLAKLITKITIEDPTKNSIDPCCGTGTILREIINLKKEKTSIEDAFHSTWGSDKYTFPLLIASINIIKPEYIGIQRQLFNSDATKLEVNKIIEFNNVFTGDILEIPLPKFHYIISNLPFVKQENVRVLNPNINEINSEIEDSIGREFCLDNRTDLYGYFPFYLYKIMAENARLSIITSNSWLGTTWGKKFFHALRYYFKVNSIIVSGKGRWFNNSKVVSTILVLDKKEISNDFENTQTKFVVLKKECEKLNSELIEEHSALIHTKNFINDEDINIYSYSNKRIDNFQSKGFTLGALFSDINWVENFFEHIIPVKDCFSIIRGERRGWNKFFYPKLENEIEDEYLKPVLRTPKSLSSFFANTDTIAFCCSRSKEELRELGHFGALNWIERFESQTNTKGKPLPVSLKKPNKFWYELVPNSLGEFVACVNYGDRLFISKFHQPSFVDQRFILLTATKYRTKIYLLHALLNSILSMFLIESIGFGRGEGVLDLNKDFFAENFHILDPAKISPEAQKKIISTFKKVIEREPLSVVDELQSEDRGHFDFEVLDAFGLTKHLPNIKKSLLELFTIRNSVNR